MNKKFEISLEMRITTSTFRSFSNKENKVHLGTKIQNKYSENPSSEHEKIKKN